MDVMYKITTDEYRILSIQFIYFTRPSAHQEGQGELDTVAVQAAQEEGQRRPERTMGKPELK